MSSKNNLEISNNLQIKEKYGLTGNENIYTTTKAQNKFVRLHIDVNSKNKNVSKSRFIYNFCRKVFLPQGYPHSVSDDYFEYQLYDTIQAFASRITGTISTKSILKSVGVGNIEATPLSAAITWIFKDGIGMFGGILFAWFKGSEFDANCKKWRLFADILNDLAMTLELFLPFFTSFTTNLTVLCLTTCMKSMVGVAGSATRAAVTQHQALAENAAEVAAKDGSQETAVNLAASIVGILLLTLVQDSKFEISLFLLFLTLHLLSNYLAVKSLIFHTLNTERFILNCKSYFRFYSIPDPISVNRSENVLLLTKPCNTSLGFCGFDIRIGNQFSDVINDIPGSDLRKIIQIHKKSNYVIIPNVKQKFISILLKFDTKSDTVLTAYFHALIFGLGFHIHNNLDLQFLMKKTAQNNLITRLRNKLQCENIDNIQLLQQLINIFVEKESIEFLRELEKKGWKTNVHSIPLDDWRFQDFEYIE